MNIYTGEYRRERDAEMKEATFNGLIIFGIIEVAIAMKILISLIS